MSLTAKREKFAIEYLVDLNATAAAKRAGYSEKSAVDIGPRLLKDPDVLALIEKRRVKISEKTGLTVEKLDEHLTRIAFSDLGRMFDEQGELLPIHAMDADSRASLAGFDVEEIAAEGVVVGRVKKVKVLDRLRAIELGYKRLGVLRDNPLLQIGQVNIVVMD